MRCSKKRRNQTHDADPKKVYRGFTLIELLVVVGMLAVVSLAIYGTINNGIKIWNAITKPLPGEEVAIVLDKFNRDVKNAFEFKGIEFWGDEGRLEIPTLVYSKLLQKRTVGKTVYYYDASERMLCREEQDFSQVYGDRDGNISPPVRQVRTAEFAYYFYDDRKKEYRWLSEWEHEGFPLAVRIRLLVGDDNDQGKFTRTVSIPVGN